MTLRTNEEILDFLGIDYRTRNVTGVVVRCTVERLPQVRVTYVPERENRVPFNIDAACEEARKRLARALNIAVANANRRLWVRHHMGSYQ